VSERAGTAPLLYLGQDGSDVSPRVLVQTTFYEPWDGDVSYVAYDALQPSGCIGDDPGGDWDRSVIGFAEFPRNQPVSRYKDPQQFVETVNAKAVYVHWKPEEDEIGVLGKPPLENVESGGESA
jgi:hypothetical protein